MNELSSNSNSKKKIDYELQDTLSEAHSLGSELSEKGRELTAAGQYIMDWVDITKEAIPLIDTNQGLMLANDSWKNTNSYVCQTMNHLNLIDINAVSSTSTGSALTTILNIPDVLNSKVEASAHSESAECIFKHIEEQTTKSHEKDALVSLIQSLQLDSLQKGKRSSLQQLETAYKAFEITVDTSTPSLTSLIPMRECILQIIDILLKNRKRQEKTTSTSRKVTSILIQLKRDSVSEKLIEDLAIQCKDILDNRLSPSKNTTVTRLQWQKSLVVSILWLKAFLLAIDPNKMRQNET